MHFEILVEDLSGKVALDILVPKIIRSEDSFTVRNFKGIGHIPRKKQSAEDVRTNKLLNELPRLVSAYGKSWHQDYGAVILVCDLDQKPLDVFLTELSASLAMISPKPKTEFCLAIEEGEAWLLGDIPAIRAAYPNAKAAVLSAYKNDSICGTWEKLADAVYKGGAQSLSQQGQPVIGKEKSTWANNIAPHMDVHTNLSPSFNRFVGKLRALTTTAG